MPTRSLPLVLITALSSAGLSLQALADEQPAVQEHKHEAPAPQEPQVQTLIRDAAVPAQEKPAQPPAEVPPKQDAQPQQDAQQQQEGQAEQQAPAKQEEGEPQEEGKLSDDELRARMAELEKELRDTRDQFQQRANEDRQKQEQQQQDQIEKITLPQDPTRKQCEDFVAELREAAKNKRSYSSNDPIVDKLKSLPEEHVDLLMLEISNRTTLRYFANYAMRGMSPEKMRDRIVSTLKDNPNNIGIIVMNGWTMDVRDEILRQVQSADANLSPAWFQAAVEVADPRLYPKLHEITTGSRYASQFLMILRALPDYDLAHTVNVCWNRAGDEKLPVSQQSFALLAAEMGNVDALGMLITQLSTSNSYYAVTTSPNISRVNVLRFIDFRGSNEEMKQWFTDNRDQLVFDHLQKRFVFAESTPTPTPPVND